MYETIIFFILIINLEFQRYLIKKNKYVILFIINIIILILPYFINNKNNKSLIYAISTILIIICMRIVLILKNIEKEKQIIEKRFLFYRYIFIGKKKYNSNINTYMKKGNTIFLKFFINFIFIDLLLNFLKTINNDIINCYYKRIPYNICLIFTILLFQEQEYIIFFILRKKIITNDIYNYESLFKNPWLSTNPKDLWGNRWHQMFRELYIEVIYHPLKNTLKLRYKNNIAHIFSILLVFISSGLIHEYINFCATHNLNGLNIIFFLIHGIIYVMYELFPFLNNYKFNFIYIIITILSLDLFCKSWINNMIFLEFDVIPFSIFNIFKTYINTKMFYIL